MASINFETKLRPCWVEDCYGIKKKALFHCWCSTGDVMECTRAIVELDNGSVALAHPESITFEPGIFNAYVWREG